MRWNPVSNTATCGMPGNAACARTIPSTLAGLCNGASGESVRSAETTSSSTTTGSVNRRPPCTTRCPTATRSSSSTPGPCSASAARAAAKAARVVRAVELALVARARPPRDGAGSRPPISDTSPDRDGEPARGVDQLVLQRRRPGVDDEHVRARGHAGASLHRRDRDRVDDVAHQGAARQVVDRPVQALQHRPDRDRVGAALHRLVGVVAGVEVGEDEHRRPAGDRAVLELGARRRRGSTAASYWIGPSTSSSGARSRTSAVAARTFSTSAPVPDSPVEYDSIATRGSMPKRAAVCAEEIAMSASCSAVGSGLTAQSP